MSQDPRLRPASVSRTGHISQVLSHLPLNTNEAADIAAQHARDASFKPISSNDPVILANQLSLPAYAILTDPKSRMVQPQFLNRDTYGTLPAADRRKDGESTYQVVYDVAADVRERFANNQPLHCRPFTVSTAQSEFLGTEIDNSGRESINFVALNANITGYDAATERPFSIVGHLEAKIYVPPGFSTTPGPFYAFPVNSTSLRPSLEYLQPNHPHRLCTQTLANPAGESLQIPNVPRDKYCIPPIEADTQEPTPQYRYHTIPSNESPPDDYLDWEFLGRTITGAQRWRERCSNTTSSSNSPTSTDLEDSVMSFTGELPNVPDDTEDLNKDFSKRTQPVFSKLPEAIIAQIPDKRDRFSRPIIRYTKPTQQEGEFDRLSRVSADLARTVRQNQRARRGMPHMFLRTPIARRRSYPPSTSERTHLEDDDMSSSIGSLPSTHIVSDSDEDAHGSLECEYVDSDDESNAEEDSSEEIDIGLPLSTPLRPLESGDSYFPPQPIRPATPYFSPSSLPSVCSSDDNDDSLELFYPPTPPLEPIRAMPPIVSDATNPVSSLVDRSFSLSPLILPAALINLPPTTPLARLVPALHLGASLSNFAQAAITGAEKVLNGFKSVPTSSSSNAIKDIEDRVTGLERTQQALLSSPLRDPSTKFPFEEDEDTVMKTSNDLAALLAGEMRAPRVYRAEVDLPSIDTELLLGFSKGISIPPALPDLPILRLRLPTLFLDPLTPWMSIFLFRPSSPTGSITESEAEVMDDIFRWDDYEDEEYRAAEEVVREAEVKAERNATMARRAEEKAKEEERNDEWIPKNTQQSLPVRPKSRLGYVAQQDGEDSEWINILKTDKDIDITIQDFLEEMELTEWAQHADGHAAHSTQTEIMMNARINTLKGLDKKTDRTFHQQSETRTEQPIDSSSGSSTHAHSLPTERTLWGPSSRRPMRSEIGHISYDRTANGCADYMNGSPPWPVQERRRAEVLGYALEFPDSAILQAHVKFRTKLASNLHQEKILHTERRIRQESEHKSHQRNNSRLLTPLTIDVYPEAYRRSTILDSNSARLTDYTLAYRPEAHYFSPGYDYSQDFSYFGFPDLPRVVSHRILEYEHAKRTKLAIIDRSTRHRYEGSFANTATAENSFKDHDEQPTKRRKIHASPLGHQVVSTEAIKAVLIDWQPYLAGLRDFRNDIFFTIQRLIEALEYFEGRVEFRKIFFPFEEDFAVTTIRDMYDMERSFNPDGFFRRTSYHLNSLLHDAEANFLQACATFFRATRDYELAYILEELLSMQFRDDMGVMQLLRGGFVATSHDWEGSSFDSSFGNLQDRFNEFEGQHTRERIESI
ncbi:hypothetical protein C8F04DRAFT_1267445 [Mycena alexandri]|uniref:Uncharacterized protein n=1 Tax=Mycena alexandri TaxID=1745969 RepID=A0AAD6SHN8_9AGAR|nr:hypothetical protein C8F04DRAFT_1267445 [Mycena alexandri]